MYTLKEVLKSLDKEINHEKEVYYRENLYCSYEYLLSECEEKAYDSNHLFNQKIWEGNTMDLRIYLFGESVLVYKLDCSPAAKEELRKKDEEARREYLEYGSEQ